MYRRNHFVIAFVFLAMLTFSCGSPEKEGAKVVGGNDYADLVSLFEEFREFQKPKVTSGVPDYTEAAMKKQRRGLKKFQSRLEAIDISGWPISQQVDYHMVRAEMNALEFYHRVLRPWSRFPAFYLRSRVGAGPSIFDTLQSPELRIHANDIAEFRIKLKAVPKIFEQAKSNLTEGVGDVALLALRWSENEISLYETLLTRLKEHHPDLISDAEQALAAAGDYGDWLKENKDTMISPAGIGIENFNWWMKNVHLFPYTWDELRVLAEREYDRAYNALKLVENRNRNLPALVPVSTEAEYTRRYEKFEKHILNFLREGEIFTVPDYLKTGGTQKWWNAPGGEGEQNIFRKCRDLNPLAEISHGFIGHDFYWLKHDRDNRPIRGAYPQFRIHLIHDEGWAFVLEEMLLNAGLYDDYPRGKEITYIAQIFRAVRMMADLKIHSNEFTVKDAIRYYAEKTPYGWVDENHRETSHDIEMGVSHPGYAMAYVGGKFQIEALFADRAHQLGKKFNLRDFMDELIAAGGMVPFSLIRWEMTGLDDEVKKLWK